MTTFTTGRHDAARLGQVLIPLSALIGCAAAGPEPSAVPLSVSDRLYLGRSIPGDTFVANADWDAFVRQEVTPRFPGELTIQRAQEHWREPVMIVEIVYTREGAADVTAIALAYKRPLAQESGQSIKLRQLGRWSFRRQPDGQNATGQVKDSMLPPREVHLNRRQVGGTVEATLLPPGQPAGRAAFQPVGPRRRRRLIAWSGSGRVAKGEYDR